MKITIITVVFNGESTIEETIKSVLSQSYANMEYIVIDGLSTDGTMQIVNRYKSSITRIISEKDWGMYDAMNKGIRFATGDVIGFLNADDTYAGRDVIANVIDSFHKGAFLVWGNLHYVDRNNVNEIKRVWIASNYNKSLLKKGWHPPHPAFFVHKKVYDLCGNFDLRFRSASDAELMIRIFKTKEWPSQYIPSVLVLMKTGGQSNSSFKQIIKQNILVYKALKKNNVRGFHFFIFYKLLDRIKQLLRTKI